jgi:endonuclease G
MQARKFRLNAKRLFQTDKLLDVTVIGVELESTADTGHYPLSAYPVLRFEFNSTPTAGQPANIIQHPEGRRLEIAFRENDIISASAESAFVHYTTDTLPGSSGSPVFNDEWKIIALHHSGVPRTNARGQYVDAKGKRVDYDNVEWIANEGILASALRDKLATKGVHLNAQGSNPIVLARAAAGVSSSHGTHSSTSPCSHEDGASAHPAAASGRMATDAAFMVAGGNGSWSFTVPLHIQVTLGMPQGVSIAPLASSSSSSSSSSPPPAPSTHGSAGAGGDSLEIRRNADEFATCDGFDPEFLGVKVPLPTLSPAQLKNTAKITDAEHYGPRRSDYELCYHNYSVALCRSRRLAWFSCVNIDGAKLNSKNKRNDKWFFDPRVPEEFQVGEKYYKQVSGRFDKGHLTSAAALNVDDNDDCMKFSFSMVNCSPQTKEFNGSRGMDLWRGLEDYVRIFANQGGPSSHRRDERLHLPERRPRVRRGRRLHPQPGRHRWRHPSRGGWRGALLSAPLGRAGR